MTGDPEALIAGAASAAPATEVARTEPGGLDLDAIARRALYVGRRTALGVLAGDHATADDVAQETAIQAVRHAHRLRDAAALDAWLFRTATRASLRAARRGRRRRTVEEQHAEACVHPTETLPPDDDLARLLRMLPERQRAALTLRYVHDLDDARIARAIGCRPGTVRALLSRGRATLRHHLDRHDDQTTPGEHHA